tara:strand:+ start:73 stop:750 length:678 start_codon:yes stop_codon:yes gene_type:complete
MSPDSAFVVECELTNTGTNAWLPVINSDGNANYYVELRGRATDASEDPLVLWRTDVEELPRRGEVVSVFLRLSSGVVLDDFECDLFFCYPEGEIQSCASLAVQIKLDEKWEFLRRVFGQVAASDMSGWVNVPELGDLWLDSFPFVYQHEHGWLKVDVENSMARVLSAYDFKLGYFSVHLKQPHIFHLKGEHSRRLLFRGVFDGQRTFLDTDSGETLQYPLSVGED